MIAGCLSEEEIRGLKEMFKGMDSDNSGTITVDELRKGLAKKGTKLTEAKVQQLMEAVSKRPEKFSQRLINQFALNHALLAGGRERDNRLRRAGWTGRSTSTPPSSNTTRTTPPSSLYVFDFLICTALLISNTLGIVNNCSHLCTDCAYTKLVKDKFGFDVS